MDDADDAIDDSFVRRPSSFLVVARPRRALQSVGSVRRRKVPLGRLRLDPKCILYTHTSEHEMTNTDGSQLDINFSKRKISQSPGRRSNRSVRVFPSCLCVWFLCACVLGRRRRGGARDEDEDEDGRGTTPVTGFGFTEVRRYVVRLVLRLID
jgi:hypothetical protein